MGEIFFSKFVLQALLNSLWQGAIILMLVYLILKIFKKISSSTRYFILMTAIIVLFALSAGSSVYLTKKYHDNNENMSLSSYTAGYYSMMMEMENDKLESEENILSETERSEIQDRIKEYKRLRQDLSRTMMQSMVLMRKSRLFPIIDEDTRFLILYIWIAITAVMFLRLLVSCVYSFVLKRMSKQIDINTFDADKLKTIQEELTHYNIRITNALNIPATVGFFRQVIILPSFLLDILDIKELRYVILHEAGHIKRRDIWTNLIQRVVEALFFFNPVVYKLSGKLDEEREKAVDELVVSQIRNRNGYAASLLKLVKNYTKTEKPILSTGAISSPFQIGDRIKRIVRTDLSRMIKKSRSAILTFYIVTISIAAFVFIFSPLFAIIAEDTVTSRNILIRRLFPRENYKIHKNFIGMWDVSGKTDGGQKKFSVYFSDRYANIKSENRKYEYLTDITSDSSSIKFSVSYEDGSKYKGSFNLKGDILQGTILPENDINKKPFAVLSGKQRSTKDELIESGTIPDEEEIYPFLGTWEMWGEINGKKEFISLTITNHYKRSLILGKVSSMRRPISSGYFGSRKFGIVETVTEAEVNSDTLQFHFTPAGRGYPRIILTARFVMNGDEIKGGWPAGNLLSPEHPVYLIGKRRNR